MRLRRRGEISGEGAGKSTQARLLAEALRARGAWVVCDRFLDSSRAYQGGGGGLSDEEIRTLHRIGSRDAACHAPVAAAFASCAQEEPGRFVRIDGDGSPEATQALVIEALAPLLTNAA